MSIICPYPRFRAMLSDGSPAVGYKLWSYAVGTTSLKATYADQTGITANSNPVIMDGSGEATVFLGSGGYKLVLTTDADVVIWTQDGLNVADSEAFSAVSVSGQITSTLADGTAPLVVASGTKVANLNADKLDGQDWNAPASLGAVTPNAGAFTTLTLTGALTQKAAGALQGANGETAVHGFSSEEITLSTSGTTTDSVSNLLPAGALLLGVVTRVTQTILTATDWKVGDATTAARFLPVQSVLALGTTVVGLQHLLGSITTDATGPVQSAAAKIRITTTGTPTAGKIRVTVFYLQFTGPVS